MVNITSITGNVTGVYGIGEYANLASGGIFWGVVLVSIYLVILINTRQNGFDKAFVVSSFACLILSLLLLYINWVSILYPVFFGIALGSGLFYLQFKNT